MKVYIAGVSSIMVVLLLSGGVVVSLFEKHAEKEPSFFLKGLHQLGVLVEEECSALAILNHLEEAKKYPLAYYGVDLILSDVRDLVLSKKYKKAARAALRADKLIKDRIGSDNRFVVINLTYLAYAYRAQKKYTEADPILDHIQAMLKPNPVWVYHDPLLSGNLEGLALIISRQGDSDRAKQIHLLTVEPNWKPSFMGSEINLFTVGPDWIPSFTGPYQ